MPVPIDKISSMKVIEIALIFIASQVLAIANNNLLNIFEILLTLIL